MEELKKKAKSLGLWNLFFPKDYKESIGLTNLEYAQLCRLMGRSVVMAPEATNCSAPDTGNMEVFSKYGTEAQKEKWLKPLLNGEIRSAFAMTEPAVASSDATNIETRIEKQGDQWVVNGRKWYISGAGHPLCKVLLVLGKSDPNNAKKHKQQSIVIVPMNTPGVHVKRPMGVFNYDDAPFGHCEIVFDNVKVPLENIVLGEGRGFEVIQGRLGPGRLHHCMRAVGIAERCFELMLLRSAERRTFGKRLYEHASAREEFVDCRILIEQARLLTLDAAHQVDLYGPKKAKFAIAVAKIQVPRLCLDVVDRAIQMFGAEGLSQDSILPELYAHCRTLRVVDGPDAVHRMQVGISEVKKIPDLTERYNAYKARKEELLANAKL
jgi:acyl-CoA dehydrogenase